eukprot:scaffold244861_cov30-Tisochrysis_lutea.AAC.3
MGPSELRIKGTKPWSSTSNAAVLSTSDSAPRACKASPPAMVLVMTPRSAPTICESTRTAPRDRSRSAPAPAPDGSAAIAARASIEPHSSGAGSPIAEAAASSAQSMSSSAADCKRGEPIVSPSLRPSPSCASEYRTISRRISSAATRSFAR